MGLSYSKIKGGRGEGGKEREGREEGEGRREREGREGEMRISTLMYNVYTIDTGLDIICSCMTCTFSFMT